MLVEDSIPFRKLLRDLIEASGSAEVVSEAGSVAAAHFLLHANHVDVLVLDLHLWDGDGCAVLIEVKRIHPACMVMVLTSSSTPEHREHCLRLGADYFFDKTCDIARIPEVLAGLGQAPSDSPVPLAPHLLPESGGAAPVSPKPRGLS
jgi:DNA-binding NarL/FixJ family response regulator